MKHRVLLSLLLLLSLSATGCNPVSRRLVDWKKRDYRGQARLGERRIEAAGHTLVYLDRGAGEPVVLVHGFGGDKDNWTFFARFLPDSYRVIALDLPGFGESSRDPRERYDVRAQAARLLAFTDALGLQRFHLAGNSMGGNISARFAIDHPERIRSLALLDSSGVASPHPSEVARAFAAGKNPLLVESPADFDRVIAINFVKPPAIPGFIKGYFADRAFANRAFNAKIFADMGARPDRLEGQLGKLQAPTLIIWGDQDRVIDISSSEVLMAGIRGARRAVLSQCGHTPMIERPEETAQQYLTFLASLSR